MLLYLSYLDFMYNKKTLNYNYVLLKNTLNGRALTSNLTSRINET